jgi:hypothetical protein
MDAMVVIENKGRKEDSMVMIVLRVLKAAQQDGHLWFNQAPGHLEFQDHFDMEHSGLS